MNVSLGRHLSSDHPRVLVVDGSKLVRRVIEQTLVASLPGVTVLQCETGVEALGHLGEGAIDFVTTALRLSDMDGIELARRIRESAPQAYMPIVVVSGDVQERLLERLLSDIITDYFDKSLGFQALAEFIRGYVRPTEATPGEVLYVEDSRVVALATRRMLEKHGLTVLHVVTVEEAIDMLETAQAMDRIGADLVLTDVNLKGELTGADLLDRIRRRLGYGKGQLPVIVMTGDDNPQKQAALLRAGANDLVEKPIDERLLLTKLLFQLRVSRHLRARLGTPA